MISIKFNSSTKFHKVSFSRQSENIITLEGVKELNTSGFLTFRLDGKTQLGDFSDYKTIYRETETGVQFSNDFSVYVPEKELTSEEKHRQELLQENSALHAYLDSTDWYIIRKFERDGDVPELVTKKRLESINRINEIENELK